MLTAATQQRIRDWAAELVGDILTELADHVQAAVGPVPEGNEER